MRRGVSFIAADATYTIFVRTKLSLSHALSQSVKISLVITIVLLTGSTLRRWQFEELISNTIEETKDIPEIISETGKIGMPHKGISNKLDWMVTWECAIEIMQKIGQLFLLRTNINSVGSVLDSPVRVIALLGEYQTDFFEQEIFWVRILLNHPAIMANNRQSYPDLQPLYDAARSYLEIPQRINLLNTRVEVHSFRFYIYLFLIRFAIIIRCSRTCYSFLKSPSQVNTRNASNRL